MKMTKPFFVIVTFICMSFMYVAMAKSTEEKTGPRIDLLEAQVADLQAELARVSPDSDLTGATYCLFGQGTWLLAEPGVSAEVVVNPFAARLDFTSPTELTSTAIYDPVTSIAFPPPTIIDDDDLGNETGTYTVVGNLLTLTFLDNGDTETAPFIMTPDANVFVGGSFERGGDGDVESWETAMIVGVRAANCD